MDPLSRHIVDWVIINLLLAVEINALHESYVVVRLRRSCDDCLLVINKAVLMGLVVQSIRGDWVRYTPNGLFFSDKVALVCGRRYLGAGVSD